MLIENVDHCVVRISLSWNDSVSSANRIAFAGEHERGRKQHNFVLKNAIHFVLKLTIFLKVELDQMPMRIWGGQDLTCSGPRKCLIVKSYFDPNKFREYFNLKHSKKKH